MIRLNNKRYQAGVTLADIFNEPDDAGLLDVKPLKSAAIAGDLAARQFAEIAAFVAQHKHIPQSDSTDFTEKTLARRLATFQNDDNYDGLFKDDSYGLRDAKVITQVPLTTLPANTAEAPIDHTAPVNVAKSALVTSLNDIFADDDDSLLNFDDDSIFTIKHVNYDKKALPEDIAKRQPCADFSKFESIFQDAQKMLKIGEISTIRFKHELKIAKGELFILYGIMCYVNTVGEALEDYRTYNARLHLIFENGTESNMLYQSLGAGLIRDKEGRKLVLGDVVFSPAAPVTGPATGMIYVVSTLSNHPALSPFKDLYKIGYTDTTVEQRTLNAENDKTFLEAPVRIVSTATCYHFNPRKLETLIHGFLAHQRLSITLTGKDGQHYAPREWFNAPLGTVQAVIGYIIDGSISQYRMDNTTGRIVKK